VKKKIQYFAVLFFLCLPINASVQKIQEIDFKDGQVVYLYAGTKTILRVLQIPLDLESIQLSVIEKPNVPKTTILGKRIKSVNSGNNNNFIDFIIDIQEIKPDTNINQLIQLELKTFKKSPQNEKSYAVIDRHTIYIRPIICTSVEDNVCGTYKTNCRKGSTNCTEDTTLLKTFINECEMNRFGAEYLHDGICFESTI
jgi:hypothetical protein